MARSGPVTKDTSTIALGLAQIRIGASAANIATITSALTTGESIGALANTKFTGNTDWFKLESGFPLLEDYTTPLRESAALECSFKEITPANMALAYGFDPSSSPYSSYTAHSGEVPFGGRVSPAYIRMEAVYTFPSGSNYMYMIFPRAQVSASVEIDLQIETNAAVPVTIEAKRADSEVSGGNAVWDDKPMGRLYWT